jgi:tRNA dimethylallyltransferase
MVYGLWTMDTKKTLLVIAGPTAVGKTEAAIQLAKYYKTVILSADSRQFYREMSIGTAKPSADELAAVQHYFINSHSISENFSVGDFEKQALELLDKLFSVHDVVIMAGGSGLYIKAVCEGFDDLPQADEGIRHRLNQDYTIKGIDFLQEQLKLADPEYYAEVDLNNPQRIIRALEVFESTGKTFSSYRTSAINRRPFKIIKFGLNLPRKDLYDRINRRVDAMVAQGLIDEVKSLLPYRHLNALITVGYSEIFDYLEGNSSLEQAIDLVKQHTRNFAKRQMTWFNKDKGIVWVEPGDVRAIISHANILLIE